SSKSLARLLPAQHLQDDEDHDRQAKATAEQPDQKGPARRGHGKDSCEFQHKTSLIGNESQLVIHPITEANVVPRLQFPTYFNVIAKGVTNITGLCCSS